MKRILSFTMAVLILVSLLAGCEFGPAIERIAADTSDRTFSVLHFSGLSQWKRTLSATNGSEIFYVNGENIFQLGKGEPVLAVEDNISNLAVSSCRLYVLYDDPKHMDHRKLVIYDISSGEVQSVQLDNIWEIAADGEYIFATLTKRSTEGEQKNSSRYIACASENNPEEVLCFYPSADMISESDVPVGEIAEKVFVSGENITVYCRGQLPDLMYNYEYYYNNTCYEVNSPYCTVKNNDGTEKNFSKDGYFSSYNDDKTSRYIDGGVIYALMHQVDYEPFSSDWTFLPTFNAPQYDSVRDCIVAHDLEEEHTCAIYETTDNLTRIIGYNGEAVFLFDTQTYQILAMDLATEEKDILAEIEKHDRLGFEWCADVLFVYDEQNNVVDIVEAV